ncbi:alpha/beta fold hydrolase [Halobacteriovorax sp.]|uniref:alpha/beta fold hydrolase n=1 Tax=Halobacteriovorax sp. TaxID=2020862 RepID=UPI003567BEFB
MNKILLMLISLSIVSCASTNRPSFDSELSEFKYPHSVETFSFSSQRQNLKMRYMDIGKENSKVAVLLHGKNFSGYYWERVMNELKSKGYRVIVPDQIGFGKSTKPENYQYSFAQFSRNTHELLKSLNIKKYTVVGHSMGGMLAVHMSSMFKTEVEKLVLVNPIGLETYLDLVEFKDPEFFYGNEKKKTVEMFRNYQKKFYYDGDWNDSYEELLTPFKGWKNGGDWELIAWNNALTYSPIFSDDIVDKFIKVKAPIFLINGTRDKTGPGRGWKREGVTKVMGDYTKLGKAIQKKNKKVKLIELKGLGHMPQFEDYERFSKVFYPIF